jgi:cell filamentation protein
MNKQRDNYQYIDPDYSYTDPKTGVLRNKGDISNREMLIVYESGFSAMRTKELEEKPVTIEGAKSLLTIHHHLFQDVYEWAGQLRTVEISKQGHQFFPTDRFKTAFAYIDSLIADYRQAPDDKETTAKHLANILDSVNYLHPFREGNGRAQREFIRTLALEKGYRLNLNPPNDESVYEGYMEGTINGDVNMLTKLLLELLQENTEANNG